MADASATRALVERWAHEVYARASAEATDALREAAPVGQTGETRRQIRFEPAGALGGTVTAPTKQGEWVEEGTAPHVILPRNSKVLVFEAGGETVFARKVNHPGMPAKPWFKPTTERWGEFLQRAAGEVQASG